MQGGEMGMHVLEIPTDGLIEDLSWSSISSIQFYDGIEALLHTSHLGTCRQRPVPCQA